MGRAKSSAGEGRSQHARACVPRRGSRRAHRGCHAYDGDGACRGERAREGESAHPPIIIACGGPISGPG